MADIKPTGSDTYLLTSPGTRGDEGVGWWTVSEQKAKIFEQASAYCQRQGRALRLVAERTTDVGLAKRARVEVEFRCVSG